ncbi:MAG: hypothetical protein AAFR58_14500 [Cyanobacteria bacterium J06627_28]
MVKVQAIGDVKAEGDINNYLGTLRHGEKDSEGAIAYHTTAFEGSPYVLRTTDDLLISC